jgi:hypothetical protein
MECWLESVLRNYANSEATAAGGQKTPGGKLLAWCLKGLKGPITFLEDLKNFGRYSDREWIVIILLSINIPKIFQNVGYCQRQNLYPAGHILLDETLYCGSFRYYYSRPINIIFNKVVGY